MEIYYLVEIVFRVVEKAGTGDSRSLEEVGEEGSKGSVGVPLSTPELVTRGKGRLDNIEVICQVGIRRNVRRPKEAEKFLRPAIPRFDNL
jgi:hypothetical protein